MQTSNLRFRATRTVTRITCALLALMVLPAATSAGRVPAVGDAERLWVARPNTDDAGNQTFTLLYRGSDQEQQGIRPILLPIRGQLVPGGLAAGNRLLWLVYQPQSDTQGAAVQSIRIPSSSATTRLIKPVGKVRPALPAAARLRSLSAGEDSLWALVRTLDGPKQTNQGPSDAESATPSTPAQSPVAGDTTTGRPDPPQHPGSIQAPPQSNNLPAKLRLPPSQDHLLRLNRNRWELVDLPDDWPDETHAWVVMRHPKDAYPYLLTRNPSTDGPDLRVYHYEAGSWVAESFALEAPDSIGPPPNDLDGTDASLPVTADNLELFPLAVDGQIVLGRIQQGPGRVQAELSVLRQGGPIPLGDLRIEDQAIDAWTLASYGPTVALITSDDQARLKWVRMDLQGNQQAPPSELTQSLTIPLGDIADNVIYVSVLILATVLMFTSWRRDPSWHRLNLPEGMALAQISPRLFAGAIDLAPCLLIAMFAFDLAPVDLLNEHWPARSNGWREMIPGATVIGLFVLQTMISELLFKQTVGKRILNLRVTNLEGQPPTAWQIVVRCVTKAFDLIAWLLLILPMVGPYRQRLGDLIGRTVVVTSAPKSRPEPED